MAIETPEIVKKTLSIPLAGVRGFLLTGSAGVGKTATTKKVAVEWGAEYVFIQCTPGMAETELIYTVLPSEETTAGVKLIPGKLLEAVQISKQKKVVLVLDEWDKTRPTADAFLLDFLQNARVSWRTDGESIVEGRSENIIVFLTSNAERDFSEPLLRRLIVIPFFHPSPMQLLHILQSEYSVCEEHAPLLTQIFQDTLNAQLDKPATIQELVQLEQMLHACENTISFDDLLYSVVIKTEEAWKQYTDYVHSAGTVRLGEWMKKKSETKNKTSISAEYTAEIEIKDENEKNENEKPSIPSVPSLKFKVKTPAPQPSPPLPLLNEAEEVYGVLDKVKGYDTLALISDPTDSQNRIEQWERTDEKMVSRQPVPLTSLVSIEISEDDEIYSEGIVYLKDAINFIRKLRQNFPTSKITIWSNSVMRVEDENIIIQIKKEEGVRYHLSVWVRGTQALEEIKNRLNNTFMSIQYFTFVNDVLKQVEELKAKGLLFTIELGDENYIKSFKIYETPHAIVTTLKKFETATEELKEFLCMNGLYKTDSLGNAVIQKFLVAYEEHPQSFILEKDVNRTHSYNFVLSLDETTQKIKVVFSFKLNDKIKDMAFNEVIKKLKRGELI